MFDSKLMLRAASEGNLDASEQSRTGVDFGGPDLKPRIYQVHVPQATGTSPTCDIKLQVSDNNSTWQDEVVVPQITAAGEYYFTAKSNHRYRRAHITLGGTTPNFGAVEIGPVPGGMYDKW